MAGSRSSDDALPFDPRNWPTPPEFSPRERRTLKVHDVPVELVWSPERGVRSGFPQGLSPPLAPSPADRILAEETLWTDGQNSVTENRFPFGQDAFLVWANAPTAREPDAALFELLFRWSTAPDTTAMANSIGAAATIPRAHGHVIAERLPFLDALPREPAPSSLGEACVGLECATVRMGDRELFEVRGSAAARARCCHELLSRRRAIAFNVLAAGDRTVLVFRHEETPTPDFPAALGSAELMGRFVFVDEAAFRAADGTALERALHRSIFPGPLVSPGADPRS